jgi:hypothetical protein
VKIVEFGKMAPCDQIEVMRQAAVFVFVHGAEGRSHRFMQQPISPLQLLLDGAFLAPQTCGVILLQWLLRAL